MYSLSDSSDTDDDDSSLVYASAVSQLPKMGSPLLPPDMVC